MIYFTSDQHFGDVFLLQFGSRPFPCSTSGSRQCDAFLRERYTAVVGPEDYVFFLGDVAYCTAENKSYLRSLISSLPGKKVLIRGNHDQKSATFYRSCGFLDIKQELRFGAYFLCHYSLTPDDLPRHKLPLHTEKLQEHFKDSGCSTLIHGHLHNFEVKASDGVNRINVGVDYPENNFTPITISDLPTQEIVNYFAQLMAGSQKKQSFHHN